MILPIRRKHGLHRYLGRLSTVLSGKIAPVLPSHLSPFAGGPARWWTPPEAAADPDLRLALTRALGRRESLGQVAALAQSDAMLEAGAALGRALGRGEKGRRHEGGGKAPPPPR